MNAGSVIDDVVYTDTVTKTMEEWDDSNYSGNPDFNQGAPAENEYNELDIEWSNGVVFPQIPVHYNRITDGLRNTFLVGEKSLSRNMYENGTSLGDRTSMYEGFGYGTVRNAFRGGIATEPRPDALADRYLAFGSPHRNGVNMVFCDGSLRVISYNINQVVYAKMAMRNDEDYPDKIIADPPPK
jgi:prepilin-type processing-associated H-X9-DG protein